MVHEHSKRWVGIYWAVTGRSGTQVLSHRCDLSEAEPYGNMLTCPHGHYDVWSEWQQTPKTCNEECADVVADSEYEDWPRGRVVFSTVDEKAVLYGDDQILNNPSLLRRVYEVFGLRPNTTIHRTDLHYQSTRRV